MKRRDPMQVAVVGHTNTGKTSLLRTLARDSGFGEVSDRPATTRGVAAIELLAEDEPVLRCFDTPGLEDAVDLAGYLVPDGSAAEDPVSRIEAFVAGDHDAGRFEQEAKVLRQMLRVDAALYVIDAREPVLAKHRAELRLLADCGRPLLPVLNFVAAADAEPERWRAQLARSGLHVLAEFDTVVFDLHAETRLFEKLAALIETERPRIARLNAFRAEQRRAQIDDACHAIAQLLVDAAGARRRLEAGADTGAAHAALRDQLRRIEQACVDRLLDTFAFELGAYRPPDLPLHEGRWVLDPFDPESARVLGIRTGSAAAAGGVAGFGVDALTGGLSLGAGTLVGASVGALVGAGENVGRDWLDRLRGRQTIVTDTTTLAVLATRQTQLLLALLRRGHASQQTLTPATADGWPSDAVRRAVLRARAHPEWSRLNPEHDAGGAARAIRSLAAPLRDAVADAAPGPR